MESEDSRNDQRAAAMRDELKEDYTFPPLHVARMQDLCEWHVVVAQCGACRHQGEILPHRLTRRYPKYERLLNVRRYLKCTECGNRARNLLSVRRQRR